MTSASQLPPQYTPDSPSQSSPLIPNDAVTTDAEDDFKYGVTIAQSDVAIRMGFIRKVYGILLVQLVATCGVAVLFMTVNSVKEFIHANSWLMWVSLIGSLVSMGFLFWKRRSFPLNFYLLGVFTLLEAYTVGNIVTYYETMTVIEALIITMGLFLGLTLFTFQTKYDFTGMAPYLYGALWFLVISGFMAAFFPYSRGFSLLYACIAAFIFSGYIIFDTQMIIKHLNYEEYIVAAVSLYLDVINLFLQILRIMNEANRD